MKTAKIIDLKKYVETATEGKYTTHQIHSLAIIEGPKGIIITDEDAVNMIEDSLDNLIDIHVKYNNDTIAMLPEGKGQESIANLLEKAPVTEQPVNEYIREFGDRLSQNYNYLLESIEEIGLNPVDYKKQ